MIRKLVFANEEIYHLYNRSIEQKPVFTDKRECQRAVIALDHYRFLTPVLKLSRALELPLNKRSNYFQNLKKVNRRMVEIICYCLMPNHFHFLVKQKTDKGIQKFVKNFSNSYARYFNTKHERTGPLFQGAFKAVRIEADEQLTHVSRYIHLNPTTSFLIKEKNLGDYPWSSLPEYLGKTPQNICDKEIILNAFSSIEAYRNFVHNQVGYAQELDKIKHLILDN